MGNIKASHIRVPYEITTLFVTVIIVVLLMVLLAIPFNPVLILGILIFGLIMIIVQQGIFLGNSVKVSQNQFPEIYHIAIQAEEKLQLPIRPNIYIVQDPTLNAFTIGFGRWHSVVLHSALVSALSKEELLFTIGHEMGHIKASHVLLSSIIRPFGNFIPLSDLIFGFWWRKAELTADRAGAIVVPNISSAISGFAKLAIGQDLFEKLDVISFINQDKEVEKRFADRSGEMLASHPYLTKRIQRLFEFVNSPRYFQLTSDSSGGSKKCAYCGAKNSLTGKFCISCGKTLN